MTLPAGPGPAVQCSKQLLALHLVLHLPMGRREANLKANTGRSICAVAAQHHPAVTRTSAQPRHPASEAESSSGSGFQVEANTSRLRPARPLTRFRSQREARCARRPRRPPVTVTMLRLVSRNPRRVEMPGDFKSEATRQAWRLAAPSGLLKAESRLYACATNSRQKYANHSTSVFICELSAASSFPVTSSSAQEISLQFFDIYVSLE